MSTGSNKPGASVSKILGGSVTTTFSVGGSVGGNVGGAVTTSMVSLSSEIIMFGSVASGPGSSGPFITACMSSSALFSRAHSEGTGVRWLHMTKNMPKTSIIVVE